MEALTIAHPLFHHHNQHQQSIEERISVSYKRAVLVGKASGVKAQDCASFSEKYWKLCREPILSTDHGTFILVSIHYSLCLGTIARYMKNRPDLQNVIQKLENWDYCGGFMLTELGHGLDAINIETTATFTLFAGDSKRAPRKGFILHTPSESAQKWMPPSSTLGRMPKVSVVFARLIVNGEFKGIRPFVVPLTNGYEMCKGITSKLVVNRILDHALTRFTNVELPLNALLCHTSDIEQEIFSKAQGNAAQYYFSESTQIFHSSKMALSLKCLSSLKSATYICGKYSLWRTVVAKGIGHKIIPIITFRTQQITLAHALSKAFVFSAWADHVTVTWNQTDKSVRQAVATLFKQLVNLETTATIQQLIPRCGAQGIFDHNFLSNSQTVWATFEIAEGDVQVVGIKVATDILAGKYSLPPPLEPSHILSLHERALFDEALAIAISIKSNDNGAELNRNVLPLCEGYIKAAGARMAYEAAKKAAVPQSLIDMFVNFAISQDAMWYARHMTVQQHRELRDKAVDEIYPLIDQYLNALGMEKYVNVPILSAAAQQAFHNSLPDTTGTSLEMHLFEQGTCHSKL